MMLCSYGFTVHAVLLNLFLWVYSACCYVPMGLQCMLLGTYGFTVHAVVFLWVYSAAVVFLLVYSGAALRYGSGSDQMMRLLAAPAPQHLLQHMLTFFHPLL
jgi:uncharacterized membrane protein